MQSYFSKIARIRDELLTCFAVNPDYQDQLQIQEARILRGSQQLSPCQVQIDQSTSHKQPVSVLVQSPVTHLVETEDPLEHQKRMFDFRPNLRFGPVFGRVLITQRAIATAFLVGKVLRLGRIFPNHLALPRIGRIAPHAGLIAMQQIPKQLAVVNVRCGSGHRMDQLGLAISTNMRLHAKVPLVAFSRLMHLRIPLAVFVLGRTRRIDDRGIHYRAGTDFQPVLLKICIDQGPRYRGRQRGQRTAGKVATVRLSPLPGLRRLRGGEINEGHDQPRTQAQRYREQP